MDRTLRRQLQPVSYTENQPSSDSGLEYDDEYNSHQSTNILSISPGSIESASVSDMPTPMLHQVAAGSSPARKRIQQACDTCRRKKSKCTGGQVCHECQKSKTICIYTQNDNSDSNRTVSYREHQSVQQRNDLLEWGLKEMHTRCLEFPQMAVPAEFSLLIPWLKASPVTTPIEMEIPDARPTLYRCKRPRIHKGSIRQSRNSQGSLHIPIANDTAPNAEHDSEVPHFGESQPAVDSNIIDNGLEAQAYNQGRLPSPPAIANRIDYPMANTQPSFDPSLYPESYQMSTGFMASSPEQLFSHSHYSAASTQHDPWSAGSNTSNMTGNNQMSAQDLYHSSNHYDYPYGGQQ